MAKKATDEAIIAAIMQHGTIKDAAASLGISPRTVYDRMKDSKFRAIYQAERADLLREACSAVHQKIAGALNVLAFVMEDSHEPGAVRIQAANLILSHAEKFAGRLTAAESDAESAARAANVDTMFPEFVQWMG